MTKWKWAKIFSLMKLEAKPRIYKAKRPHLLDNIQQNWPFFGLFWLSRTYLRQRPNHQQHCTSLSLLLQASLNKNIIINILTTGNIWKKNYAISLHHQNFLVKLRRCNKVKRNSLWNKSWNKALTLIINMFTNRKSFFIYYKYLLKAQNF